MITRDAINLLRAMAEGMSSALPMSAGVLTGVLDDLEIDGPISKMMSDHPDANSALFCLRALAGVPDARVNWGRPELADHLEQLIDRMGDADFDRKTWELFREALLTHPAESGRR